jgi:hypothetical protein
VVCCVIDPRTESTETAPVLFLNSSTSSPAALPADGVKLQCCAKAVYDQCRSICTEVSLILSGVPHFLKTVPQPVHSLMHTSDLGYG